MSTMKEKLNDFVETVLNMSKMANAEEVAMSEAEVTETEEAVVEQPTMEEKVDKIHDFLFDDSQVVYEEPTLETEQVEQEIKQEPQAAVEQPAVETPQVEAQTEPTIDYKAQYEAAQAELEAIKAEKNKEVEQTPSFTHNPEAEPEKAGTKFYRPPGAFETPFDKVYNVWKQSK